MQTRPSDLPDEAITTAVQAGWQRAAATATYLPVGYGSHHWLIEEPDGRRWFASVDVLDDPEQGFDQLAGALGAAATARDSGLSFVVAPIRTPEGDVLRRLRDRYAIALYPYISGESGSFSDLLSPADSADLADMLCSLHATPTAPIPGLRIESFAIPGRDHLVAALAAVGDAAAWTGPYAHRLHTAFAEHGDDAARMLREHDRLVDSAGRQTDRMVLTHGEPHPGNVIRTADGLMLVDWDTAMLAPPERDVWLLNARTGGQAAAEYTARSGRSLDPLLVARYELAWALADLADFVATLRAATAETADTAWSWEAFHGTLTDAAPLLDRLRAATSSV